MFFLLYTHNHIVSGESKSAIYDLDNSKIYNIPNAIVEVLRALRKKSIDEVKTIYTPNSPEIIDQYLEFLLKNGLGFYTKNPDRFPEMKMSYHYPGVIRDAVLESDLQAYNLEAVLGQLETLKCRYLELRLDILEKKQLIQLEDILTKTKSSIFISMVLFINYKDFLTIQYLEELYTTYPKIKKIIVHGAPKKIKMSDLVIFETDTLDTLEEKSIKDVRYIVNLKYFTESLQYNTAYNNKIAINKQGDIRNILLDKTSYGNIKNQQLTKIARSKSFQKFWKINADKIEGLKESPYRYAYFNNAPMIKTTDRKYIKGDVTPSF